MNNADYEALYQVAEAVRERCIAEASEAFERGGMSGLCVEGRWDLAMDHLRGLDLEPIVRTVLMADPPHEHHD